LQEPVNQRVHASIPPLLSYNFICINALPSR